MTSRNIPNNYIEEDLKKLFIKSIRNKYDLRLSLDALRKGYQRASINIGKIDEINGTDETISTIEEFKDEPDFNEIERLGGANTRRLLEKYHSHNYEQDGEEYNDYLEPLVANYLATQFLQKELNRALFISVFSLFETFLNQPNKNSKKADTRTIASKAASTEPSSEEQKNTEKRKKPNAIELLAELEKLGLYQIGLQQKQGLHSKIKAFQIIRNSLLHEDTTIEISKDQLNRLFFSIGEVTDHIADYKKPNLQDDVQDKTELE